MYYDHEFEGEQGQPCEAVRYATFEEYTPEGPVWKTEQFRCGASWTAAT